MAWQGWVLVLTLSASSLSCVAAVGKPREPITPGIAAWSVLVTALLIFCAIGVAT